MCFMSRLACVEGLTTDEKLYWMLFQMSASLRLTGYSTQAGFFNAWCLLGPTKQPRNYLGEKFSKEIYSSDFALQYALAARGWTIMPWEEAAQMHNDKEGCS